MSAVAPLHVHRQGSERRATARAPRRADLRIARRAVPRDVVIRPATDDDVEAIDALIAAHLVEGHLLPRRRDEIAVHVSRFVLALDGRRVVACADLAPLSRTVAEVRSLVVAADARSRGIGRRLLADLRGRAAASGFDRLCAFTHSPAYFLQAGFSIVPHTWLPEKIAADCRTCTHFRQCGQYAVVQPLKTAHGTCVPLASLHG